MGFGPVGGAGGGAGRLGLGWSRLGLALVHAGSERVNAGGARELLLPVSEEQKQQQVQTPAAGRDGLRRRVADGDASAGNGQVQARGFGSGGARELQGGEELQGHGVELLSKEERET